MYNRNTTIFLSTVILLSTIISSTDVQATPVPFTLNGYRFTEIPTAHAFSNIYTPSINNGGNVAFAGRSSAGSGGVYLYDGVGINTLAADTGFSPSLTFTNQPISLNDSGTVAYHANNGAISGIYTANSTACCTLIDNTVGANWASINNSGTVGLVARTPALDGSGRNFQNEVTHAAGAAANTFTNISRDRLAGTQYPTINNLGVMSFLASPSSGTPTLPGESSTPDIMTADSSGSITIVADASRLSSVGVWPTLNDAGTVVFTGGLRTGGNGLFVSTASTPRNGFSTLADSSGIFSYFPQFAINNDGKVVFTAVSDGGGNAALYDGGTLGRIVGPGDFLETGSTSLEVGSILFGREGLNDSGEIVFMANLIGGSPHLYTASPVSVSSVPAPPSLLLLAGALPLFPVRRWRRKHRR